MALGVADYIYIAYGVYGSLLVLVLVPVYSWLTLFFSIPLALLETAFAVFLIFENSGAKTT